MIMPNDAAVPIGEEADNGRSSSLRHLSIANDLDPSDEQVRSIDDGVRALAERRLRLICDTLDLPSMFFADRALKQASQPRLREHAAADPEVVAVLDQQDGTSIVDVVVRVGALKDPDLQERLLRYLSSIDL